MAASFPSVTVLISPEVLFTGMNSVNYLIRKYLVWSMNYLIREYLVWFFDGSWCLELEIFSDGERWQLRSPVLRC